MLRDVVLQAALSERIGDETFELWLKRGAAPWTLEDTGAVEPVAATQDFEILGLEESVAHVAQVRLKREGRYRVGYLTANPDTWPAQSRLEFTPGLLATLGAPVIGAAEWERTSGSSQRISVGVTPDDDDVDLQLLRNGTVVATAVAPHGGPVMMVDVDPPLEELHTYTARHNVGFGFGPESGAVEQFAGPAAPTGLAQIGTINNWYAYQLGWDAPVSGALTHVQDDYCGVFKTRVTTAADAVEAVVNPLEKNSSAEPNGNDPIQFDARARHLVTAFAVQDASAWATITVDVDIASDETAVGDCA